ncbi:MAG: Fur family transcriptional regulator [Thermoleophilia bacterium]|nr:transcriptional repressor [Gaiellaceae bacterium]MDW8337782.1 Fur family transcriptional regulator [Thermoleophilia bacterium]
MGAAWAEHVRDALRRTGARTGAAREEVVAYLARQECCLSAQELFDGLRSDGKKVGIASVYRALEQLADLGLVHRIDLGDGVTRFEPAHPDGAHHHHLVCGACGRIETFEDPALERRLARVANWHGYRLSQHDVVLHGSCSSCSSA